MSTQRLLKLALKGDLDAAAQLELEATRREDPELSLVAASCEGRIETLSRRVARAWGDSNQALLTRSESLLGVALGETHRAAIDEVLSNAQRRCHVRLISQRHVIEAIAAATRSPEGIAFTHGGLDGEQDLSVNAKVSVCVAVLGKRGVTVGVARCSAKTPSPGSGWRALRPWQTPTSKNAPRCARWAQLKEPDRVTLPLRALAPHARPGKASTAKPSPARLLETLLKATPDRKAFRAILTALRKRDGRPDGDALRSLAVEALDAWPDEARVVMKPWIKGVLDDRRPALNALARHLHVKGIGEADGEGAKMLRALAGAEALEVVTTISFEACQQSDAIAALLSSPHLRRLRTVHLLTCDALTPIFRAIADHTRLRCLTINCYGSWSFDMEWALLRDLPLEHLTLDRPRNVDQLPEAISCFGALRELHIGSWSIPPDSLGALLQNKPQLQRLTLGRICTWNRRHQRPARWENGHGQALAQARLPALTHLDFGGSDLGPLDVERLFEAAHFKDLTLLDLSWSHLDVGAIRALGSSPHLTQLTSLRLRFCHLTCEALSVLLDGPLCEGLQSLDLSDNRLGDEGAKRLARAPSLRGLKTLILNSCEVRDAGRRALRTSPLLKTASLQGID